MGQKVHPIGFRLGINKERQAKWFADDKDFANLLQEDLTIRGTITSKDVLLNGATIVREFGPRAWLRCCMAMVLRRPTTFLDCLFG